MEDFNNQAFDLAGKVAIVTGAGGRGNSIGRAYAIALANAGAAVAVADLNGEGAARVADEINTAGGKAISVEVDITDTEAVAAMVGATVKRFGGVDILVNNAALMVEITSGGIDCMSVSRQQFDTIIAVNVWGALNCAQAVTPIMEARGGGSIINQVSVGAYPAQSLYGVSKIALSGLTTTLAMELGPRKIRVNAIGPGLTMSEAGLQLTPDDDPWVQSVVNRCPIQPRDTPDALCGALLLLASSAGRWMTGQVLMVDGGLVMRG